MVPPVQGTFLPETHSPQGTTLSSTSKEPLFHEHVPDACAASSLSAPVCPGAMRLPVQWGYLCPPSPVGPAGRRPGASRRRGAAGRPLSCLPRHLADGVGPHRRDH